MSSTSPQRLKYFLGAANFAKKKEKKTSPNLCTTIHTPNGFHAIMLQRNVGVVVVVLVVWAVVGGLDSAFLRTLSAAAAVAAAEFLTVAISRTPK